MYHTIDRAKDPHKMDVLISVLTLDVGGYFIIASNSAAVTSRQCLSGTYNVFAHLQEKEVSSLLRKSKCGEISIH